MPRDGAMTLGDLLGRLDWLDIVWAKCDRQGCYRVHGLVAQHGRDFKLPDWIAEMIRDCPARRPGSPTRAERNAPASSRSGDVARGDCGELTPAKRVLLFCLALNTPHVRIAITHATVQQMVVRNFVERDAAGRLTLTDPGARGGGGAAAAALTQADVNATNFVCDGPRPSNLSSCPISPV
jgi:hypothetical protein